MVEKNGTTIHPPGLAMPPQQVSPQQAITILEGALGGPITLLLKGLQSAFPGLPPPLIMIAACKVLGHLVGGTFAGLNAPLAPLMAARKECREAFEKAIAEVSLTAAQGGTGPLPPAPPLKS